MSHWNDLSPNIFFSLRIDSSSRGNYRYTDETPQSPVLHAGLPRQEDTCHHEIEVSFKKWRL